MFLEMFHVDLFRARASEEKRARDHRERHAASGGERVLPRERAESLDLPAFLRLTL